MNLNENYNKSRAEWEYLIEQWIFDEQTREALKSNLLDGIGIMAISVKYGLDYKTMQRKLSKAKKELIKHI